MADPRMSDGSITGIESRRSLVGCPARLIFFPRIAAVCCFKNGYLGKQPVTWKKYCAEHRLKELLESMDRCITHRDIAEILLETALNTINQSLNVITVK